MIVAEEPLDPQELKELMERTQYPEWVNWTKYDGALTVRDGTRLMGAFTFRIVDKGATFRLGKLATDGRTRRERYRVLRALLLSAQLVALLRGCRRFYLSVKSDTPAYPLMRHVLEREGMTPTTPEKADHTAWTRRI